MESTRSITLPTGLWIDGAHEAVVRLRPLTGFDESAVAEAAQATPAERTTALLSRCVLQLGGADEIGPEEVRRLTVGDREALLLHVRGATFGERLQCVVSCPADACRAPLDVELSIRDLLLPPYAAAEEVYEADGCRFHLPTGADQEAAAQLADDLEAAVALLLERCVKAGAPASDLSSVMAELDPQAELVLTLACPACGNEFEVPFDTGDFLARELAGVRDLERDVHRLALHYHWSEPEILALTVDRRRRYLELLAEELAA
jgi:hypothetical protein